MGVLNTTFWAHQMGKEHGRRTEQQNVRNLRTYVLECHCRQVSDKVGGELRCFSLGVPTGAGAHEGGGGQIGFEGAAGGERAGQTPCRGATQAIVLPRCL